MDLVRLTKRCVMMPAACRYVSMPGRSYRGAVELDADEEQLSQRLRMHVEALASSIGERNYRKPQALAAARSYIKEALGNAGVVAETHQFSYADTFGENIFADLAPADSKAVFILGAHYDTVFGSPGANDNASGVAVLLELARLLRLSPVRHRVTLVAFDNEEHLEQPAQAMGSRFFVENALEQGQQIAGMWSLETLGFYTQQANSQRFPEPLDLFYPNKGNFVAFIGNQKSERLVRDSIRLFRRQSRGFPSEGIAAPPKFRDVERSDHQHFWNAGIPALMVSDTANFRYREYHTSDDTIDKIDFSSLARVTRLLAAVVPNLTL
jgi:Zn-dependent M28 family amino/carboxypeptidase